VELHDQRVLPLLRDLIARADHHKGGRASVAGLQALVYIATAETKALAAAEQDPIHGQHRDSHAGEDRRNAPDRR
jgi:hypothetical protein